MTVIGCSATRRMTKMPALGLSGVGQRPVTRSNRFTIAGVELRQRDRRSDTSRRASVPFDLSRHPVKVSSPGAPIRSSAIAAIGRAALDHSREEMMLEPRLAVGAANPPDHECSATPETHGGLAS